MAKKPKQAEPEDDGTRFIGYARVSTDDQDLSAQIAALSRAGVLDDNMHKDKASGVSRRRPGLSLALKDCRPGDTFIVWKLDRLGRDVIEILTRLKWFVDNDINFKSLTETIDGTTPGGRFLAAILAANAQYERDVIAQRTTRTMQYLKEQGRTFGRERVLTPEQVKDAQAMRDDGVAVSMIAKHFKCSRGTIRNYTVARRKRR
jgi:DNA invertase Pin-like site-specific DNA recombinase